MEIVQVCLFGTLVAFEHLVERTFAWRDFPVRVLTDDVSLFLFKKGHTKPVINCNRFFLKFIFFYFLCFSFRLVIPIFKQLIFSPTPLCLHCVYKNKRILSWFATSLRRTRCQGLHLRWCRSSQAWNTYTSVEQLLEP